MGICIASLIRASLDMRNVVSITNKQKFYGSEKYAFWVTLRPQSDRCHQGKAKVHILDCKTIWSEFQMAKPSYVNSILKPHGQVSRSPVVTERGEAELDVLDIKTT